MAATIASISVLTLNTSAGYIHSTLCEAKYEICSLSIAPIRDLWQQANAHAPVCI